MSWEAFASNLRYCLPEECLNQNHPQKAFTPQTYEDLNVENGFPADLFGAIALQADLLPLHLAEKFVKIPIRAQSP